MTRPDARIIVREDATRHGWETHEQELFDMFTRDDLAVVMGWTEAHPTTLAIASSLLREGRTLEQDTSMLCIVRCREWLSRSRN